MRNESKNGHSLLFRESPPGNLPPIQAEIRPEGWYKLPFSFPPFRRKEKAHNLFEMSFFLEKIGSRNSQRLTSGSFVKSSSCSSSSFLLPTPAQGGRGGAMSQCCGKHSLTVPIVFNYGAEITKTQALSALFCFARSRLSKL